MKITVKLDLNDEHKQVMIDIEKTPAPVFNLGGVWGARSEYLMGIGLVERKDIGITYLYKLTDAGKQALKQLRG